MARKHPLDISHETAQALAAYVVYRDLGTERSTAKVGKALGKSATLMERWCTAHHWVDRAAAHDASIALAAAEADKARRLKEMEQHRLDRLKVAAASRGKGVGGLQTVTPDSISDVVRLFDYADKTERLDYGEATARISLVQDPEFVALRARLVAALQPYPEALEAVIRAFHDGE